MQRKLRLPWLLALAVLLSSLPARAVPPAEKTTATATIDAITISQVDYYQDGALTVPNSEWGELTVTYTPGTELAWLNVVASPSTTLESWVLQNFPLLPAEHHEGGSGSGGSLFPLRVARGSDVTGGLQSALYAVTPEPVIEAPIDGTFFVVTIGRSQNVINSGVPSNETALNGPTLEPIDWMLPPPTGPKVTVHDGMPNVVQERNFCGPGAATNSLHWLYRDEAMPFGQTLEETQTELAANMNNNHDGNWDDKEVQGKLKFIEDHDLNLEVHYTGGVKLPTVGNYVDPDGNGTARNDGAFSCDWLANEMMRGQDIELMTNTHWVVVEAVISWDDICKVMYRDDPYQHGGSTTAKEREAIENRHVMTDYSSSTGKINIGNGDEVLQAAVAESPVPLIFEDGFESGDTSAWDFVVGRGSKK